MPSYSFNLGFLPIDGLLDALIKGRLPGWHPNNDADRHDRQFNEKIPAHREQQHLSLRQVAALLERDKAQGSKIEKGLRQFNWAQIPTVSFILKAGCDELMTLRLDYQIYGVVKDGKMLNEEMQVAEKNVNLNKKKNN